MSKCECFIKNKNIYSYLACRINLANLGGLNFNSGFMFAYSFLSSFFNKNIEIEICET